MLLDIDRIRQLVDMMVSHNLVELSLRDGDVEVNLRRPSGNAVEGAGSGMGQQLAAGGAAVVSIGAETESQAEDDGKLVQIKSPMVGTFYAAPNPDSPPFVQAGSEVKPNTVVCIVEAMKVFNEIKAELAGTIHQVLVKNEDAVEYGQPLFSVHCE